MIYPAIQIGTQWVMVGPPKEQILSGSLMATHKGIEKCNYDGWSWDAMDSVHEPGFCLNIQAAFPKLEGVPLIPEAAFKTPNMKNIVRGTFQTPQEKLAFDSGFSTAGGYTREDIKQFPEWLYDGGWEFNAIARCWAHVNGSNKTTSDLVDIYINSLQKLNLPTAFDCEENPDGSPKIENDTIVVKNVIR